jgi:hypothetical protein
VPHVNGNRNRKPVLHLSAEHKETGHVVAPKADKPDEDADPVLWHKNGRDHQANLQHDADTKALHERSHTKQEDGVHSVADHHHGHRGDPTKREPCAH